MVPPRPRGGDAVERGRQVAGRNAETEGSPRDRAGGRADDDGGGPWVPAGLALEGGQDPGLVRLSDDTAGTEHEPDPRRLSAREPTTNDLHHPLFYPSVRTPARNSDLAWDTPV